MSILFSTIIFSCSVIFVASDGYDCTGNTMRNPPLDLNEAYYFPENWNEGMPPAMYNPNQMCNWQINVPDGMYATVFFYKYNHRLGNSLYTTYPNGEIDFLRDNDTTPYIFTSLRFQIDLLANEQQGLFSFKVIWSNYPTNICQNPIELDSSNLFPVYPTACTTTFTAPNKVWLVGFLLNGMQTRSLRQSAVYEGESINGNYIGNLLDAYNDNIKLEGKTLTVYTFGLLNQVNHTLFLALDVQAAGDVTKFTGLDCSDYPSYRCAVQMSSVIQTTAVVTSSRNVDYLKTPTQIPSDGTLNIYEGQINKDSLLTSIDRKNFFNQFPIAVKSGIKIYKLDKGSLTSELMRRPEDAAYDLLYVGRYIRIHSFDVHEISYYQDTNETFTTGTSKSLLNFNFNVEYFNYNSPATTLDITVMRDGNKVFYERYFEGNYPPVKTFKVLGDSITFDYQTQGIYTRGFIVDLVCTANDETPTVSPQLTSTTKASQPLTTVTSLTTKSLGIQTTKTSSVTTMKSGTATTIDYETTTKSTSARIYNLFLLLISLLIFC